MIVENRVQRKTLVGLLYLLFSVLLVSIGYFANNLTLPFGFLLIVLAAAVFWMLHTMVVLDALYTDRESKVEV